MLQLSTPSTSFFYVRPKSVSLAVISLVVLIDVRCLIDFHANPRISTLQGIGIPVLMSCLAYAGIKALKRNTYDDVDEVWLDGDTLIVKNRGKVSRVALGDVTDAVDATARNSTHPLPRLRLTLRSGSSSLGDSISFLAGGAGRVDSESILAMLQRRIDGVGQSSG